MMFATKLILRYAVKPTSPPRNLRAQEVTRTFKVDYDNSLYSTANISKNESQQPLQDSQFIQSIKLPRHRLCSRSEPTYTSHRNWSEIERSSITYPNFKTDESQVKTTGKNVFVKKPNPHRVGSLPKGNILMSTPDAETIEAALNIVQNIINRKEVKKKEDKTVARVKADDEKETEKIREDNPEPIKIKKELSNKPYVINIFLDSKKNKEEEEEHIRNKIKEIWRENLKEYERKYDEKLAKIETQSNVRYAGQPLLEGTEEEEVLEDEPPRRKYLVAKRKSRYAKSEENRREFEDMAEYVPEYQEENMKHIHPSTESTANPHTERLPAGSPPTYDLETRIKDVIAKVTPINTKGFSKFIELWKQIWEKKNQLRDEEQSSGLENDQVSQRKHRRKRSAGYEISDGNRKASTRYQQRSNYSTIVNPQTHNQGYHLDNYLLENFERNLLGYPQRSNYSTMNRFRFRCDPTDTGGMGSKTSEKDSKGNQTRVEEFVNKFKKALDAELKPNFKKVEAFRDPKDRKSVEVKVSSDRSWPNSKSSSKFRENDRDGASERITDKIKRKAHSAKKNK